MLTPGTPVQLSLPVTRLMVHADGRACAGAAGDSSAPAVKTLATMAPARMDDGRFMTPPFVWYGGQAPVRPRPWPQAAPCPRKACPASADRIPPVSRPRVPARTDHHAPVRSRPAKPAATDDCRMVTAWPIRFA